MSIKIYGAGWVGTAMQTLFPNALVHDPAKGLVATERGDIGIICVPTPIFSIGYPYIGEGKLDTSIVEEVVKTAPEDFFLIRSTINPGTCDYLAEKYHKNIVMQPEYLGETVNHPMTNQKERPFVIIGGTPENRRKVIELYTGVYNANTRIRQVSAYEAEVIKLSENRAIAFKVAECQELYDACEKAGVDYYTIRDAVYGDDPRFNLWWTFIYPDKRGMNSKCLPKDVYAWCAWAESMGYDPEITRKLLERNEKWIKS